MSNRRLVISLKVFDGNIEKGDYTIDPAIMAWHPDLTDHWPMRMAAIIARDAITDHILDIKRVFMEEKDGQWQGGQRVS
jgi:hypothetical protein